MRMRTGISLTVSPSDHRRLVALAKDRNSPQKHVWRTRAGFDEADKAAGVGHARTVIASGADDATALAIAGFAITMLSKDHTTALSAVERALSLNASCATALYFGAYIHAISGNPATATTHANRALRLSPFDPFAFMAYCALGAAAVQETRYDEAASHFAKAVQANPRFSTLYFLQAASLALAERKEEARPIVQRLLELEPGFRLRVIFEVGMVREVADRLARRRPHTGVARIAPRPSDPAHQAGFPDQRWADVGIDARGPDTSHPKVRYPAPMALSSGTKRQVFTTPIREHLNAIWKNAYSIVVTRRRVFTQPRPGADMG